MGVAVEKLITSPDERKDVVALLFRFSLIAAR
jgi:hypothetical protein